MSGEEQGFAIFTTDPVLIISPSVQKLKPKPGNVAQGKCKCIHMCMAEKGGQEERIFHRNKICVFLLCFFSLNYVQMPSDQLS